MRPDLPRSSSATSITGWPIRRARGRGTCGPVAAAGGAAAVALPAEFDAERYRAAVLKRFDKLNFEMLDTTGAFYSGVRLWSVFVPQSVRECHQYNPRLLEIPKEHQQRLLDAGEITAKELEEAERQADRLRQEYFHQPLRPVLDVVDEALRATSAGAGRKLVILGDPGSGKSSLIRYLALRWAGIAEPTVRDTQPIPLVIELGAYARWQCDGRKDFVRFLEEAPRLARMAARPAQPAARTARPGRAAARRAGRSLRRADARVGRSTTSSGSAVSSPTYRSS